MLYCIVLILKYVLNMLRFFLLKLSIKIVSPVTVSC